jgi:1-acyl-sn-glycerol-3-phosphate acyltransferase
VLYIILWVILWIAFRTIVAILGGLSVENASYVPKRGSVIIAPNHISFSDPILVAISMRRFAYFLATDEMFTMPVLGKLARIMRAIPIRQDSPDRTALRRTTELLKKGEAVVIFPEGHVSKHGELQPIQAGTIMLAVQTNTPIVPVGLIASDKLMPPHQWKLHHAGQKVEVKYGRPLGVEELTGGLKGKAGLAHGVKVLEAAIANLTGQDRVAGAEPVAIPDAPKQARAEAVRPIQNTDTVAERAGIGVY